MWHCTPAWLQVEDAKALMKLYEREAEVGQRGAKGGQGGAWRALPCAHLGTSDVHIMHAPSRGSMCPTRDPMCPIEDVAG